jgi:hypothetical protein
MWSRRQRLCRRAGQPVLVGIQPLHRAVKAAGQRGMARIHQQQGRAHIVGELLLFLRAQAVIEGGVDEPELGCGQQQIEMGEMVQRQDADAIAPAHPRSLQAACQARGALVQLRVIQPASRTP